MQPAAVDIDLAKQRFDDIAQRLFAKRSCLSKSEIKKRLCTRPNKVTQYVQMDRVTISDDECKRLKQLGACFVESKKMLFGNLINLYPIEDRVYKINEIGPCALCWGTFLNQQL